VIYRLWPVLKDGTLVRAQFWIAVIGSLTIPVGAGLIANQMGTAVAAAGSALAILGAVLMVWIFWSRAGEG
jgi:membrane protein YdbS with pleckstrin-like domain